MVDTFFIMDLCFNFVRPTDTGNRARNLTRIRKNYMSFWFWVDCISSIPYDMIGNSKMKSFRLVRLMRLAKLGQLGLIQQSGSGCQRRLTHALFSCSFPPSPSVIL